jgi:site-specific DNA-methyltransferase (adenine-specific)
MNFKIDNELKNLIPPLSNEEYQQLEQNLISEGIRDALVLGEYLDEDEIITVLIDGYNRHGIAQKHGLTFDTTLLKFDSYEDVKEWMIKHQFGRRNLNNYQRSVLALELESIFKEKAKDKQGARNDLRGNIKHNCAEGSDKENTTAYKLGKLAKVSDNTIKRVKKIQEKATPEIKEQLEKGEISVNQAYKEVRKVEKEDNFIKNKALFDKEIVPTKIQTKLYNGDCLEFIETLDTKSIDLLVTDPPYAMDFNSGWSKQEKIKNDSFEGTLSIIDKSLNAVTPKLKDNAHVYIFSNMRYLEHIAPIIRKYINIKNILIWDREVIGMGDLSTYGFSYDIIFFGYKKEGVFKKLNGTRERDILQFKRVVPSADDHPTPKPVDLIKYIIKKSSNENDNVLDLFLGGGSTIKACIETNRNIFGAELDKQHFDKFIKKYTNEL